MSGETIQTKQERVWEIDALRGLLILCVLATHLYRCVDAFCVNGYYQIDSYEWVNTTDPLHFWFDWGEDGVIHQAFLTPALQQIWIRMGVSGFFVISGISCLFSKDNLKQTLRLFAAALFIAVFTKGLALWTGDPSRFIRFGVLPCYALCHLLYVCFLKKRSNETLFFVSAFALAVGYFLRYYDVPAMKYPIFYIFGVPQIGDWSGDYWPLFPMLGWFLVGVVFGRKYYSEKRSLIPSRTASLLTRPLQWLGRHSGGIYVGHIVLYTVIFCGIGFLFHLY